MKKIMDKLMIFYFNSEKKYTRVEIFWNWIVTLLPFVLITALMVWTTNANGVSKEEIAKHQSLGLSAALVVICMITLLWFIVYKTVKRRGRRKGKVPKPRVGHKYKWYYSKTEVKEIFKKKEDNKKNKKL